MMVDINMVPNINDELKDMMDDAGFENITVVYKYFPLDMKKKKGRLQW
jgi:hypothetical protein